MCIWKPLQTQLDEYYRLPKCQRWGKANSYYGLTTFAYDYGPSWPMTFREKLATNLRRLREERGLSQEEFAELADLHRTYISMIERQTRNPTVDVLEKICLALGVELGDLFK